MTSMLPRPPAVPMDNVLISALPRPPAVPTHDALTSALFDSHGMFTEQAHIHTPVHTFPRPLELVGTHSTMTSALPRPPAAPGDLPTGDDTMQRPADRVDTRTRYTNVEQLLADSSRLPPMASQPLLPDSIDTLFQSTVPWLPAIQPTVHHYQNISAGLSLPITVSTLANVPTYVGAPPSYTEDSQRVPIAVEHAGLSAFSRVDSRPAIADSVKKYTI